MRKRISAETMRLLYAHSGNRCAFKGCSNPIFEDNGVLTGECCHISAVSPNGPRFNANLTDEERNESNNLILLCSRHHKVIDSNPDEYTVDILQDMKRVHEAQFSAKQLELTTQMLQQLSVESEKYWQSIRNVDQMDETGFKIKIEKYNHLELMQMIKKDVDNLESLISSIANSSYELQDDLETECNKCGINFELFNNIPYYENSLINRDWEIINRGFPNIMNTLKIECMQFCVLLLEELTKYDYTYSDLLDKCRQKLQQIHQEAYYFD